ncbi:lipid A disaccharide synthase [Alcanivorax sp. MD8A]|uniref:lipid-A-disaccharide synthase n=1 Tax=Alcanivorax sp. MD8A TaxID=1177157 RepID=UPI000C9CBFC1|nr:lipid-A-disaccharide synthase [Alcanivorax sp. MD8A]MEE2870951.1 lipid-A-disaccharide synthase [Pseudomonadota bacterium]PNE03212.1 lipid A disaccharide synthase [Alcanivorax sp. MD8A]
MGQRMDAPLIALIAGEASGDILGAGLMQSLQARYPGARFIGVGGQEMAAAGLDSLFPMEKLSVMGITEVLSHLPELLRLRKQLVRFLLREKPDVVIGIDSPDFTLPIARRLHDRGLKTVHYVSPSVWAWRQGRIKGIKKSIDLMLCLLPFEARFYEEHQVPVAFVGHPLADRVPLETDSAAARRQLGLEADATTVAVLPGSRGGEVGQLMPAFLDAMVVLNRQRPALQFVVPAANAARREQIEALLAGHPGLPATVIDGESRTVMAAADVILMASGTATLEGLLVGKPMVVGYRVGAVTFAIASRLVKSEFVSLPNLLCREEMVPELIQDGLTTDAIVASVEHWLDNPDKARALISRFQAVHQQLRGGASEKAAKAVSALLERTP